MEKRKYKIHIPNGEFFNGQRLGVQFKNGEAIAEIHSGVASELESWGYVCEEIVEECKETPKKAPTKKAPKKNDK